MENYFQMNFDIDRLRSMSVLGLAHIGDGVYELLCRAYLCEKGDKTVLKLHKDTIDMVKAPAQAAYADKLLPHLDDEEQGYYRRGKNAHTHASPKSATKQEYAKATGLETLFGALYLLGRTDRLNELFDIIIKEK
ncbi:MAG: ribonuclease III [Oscillospiraceae bacterium]|nr:ribonuclease III [Oscillospiraceae bacterium]